MNMTKLKTEATGQDLIQRIIKTITKLVPEDERPLVATYVQHFYTTANQDLLSRVHEQQITQGLYDLWQFFRERPGNAPKFRVYLWQPDAASPLAERIMVDIVNKNMSFLVDSLQALLQRLGTKARLTLHPLYQVQRNKKGCIEKLSGPSIDRNWGIEESLIHCEIVDQVTPQLIKDLEELIPKMLGEIQFANEDWMPMRAKTLEVLDRLSSEAKVDIPPEEFEEIKSFLKWVEDGHFTYLGYCNYDLDPKDTAKPFSRSSDDAPLGILKDKNFGRLQDLFEGIALTPATLDYIASRNPIMINKTSQIAFVHRSVQMDSIGIKRFDAKGKVCGIHLFVGLFTSVAYDSSCRDIPLLKGKVRKIIQQAGFNAEWHDGKALIHILDSLPRDELFQATIPELTSIGLDILKLQERSRLAFFARRDQFDRFLSCLVYIPRERFDSELCERIGKILETYFQGTVGLYKAQFGGLSFARVHYTVTMRGGIPKKVDFKEIEEILVEASQSWADHLKQTMIDNLPEVEGARLYRHYRKAFSKGYQERFLGQEVLEDIRQLEGLSDAVPFAIRVYATEGAKPRIKIKLYHQATPLALSDVLPILENLDLRVISENPFSVGREGEAPWAWIHDFDLELLHEAQVPAEKELANLAETFMRVYQGTLENDGFNRLVMRANLNWRQCMLLRGYAKYIRQLQIPFSNSYVSHVLLKYPHVVALLMQHFEEKFQPDGKEPDVQVLTQIQQHLEQVDNADDDRILRIFLNVIQATVRTNAFQKTASGDLKSYVAFKFSSRLIDELPLPKPLYEIFVYSSLVEGIHLRGGKVARGGIRWSDRQEDFRTEVLGLMKAQMVKNAVIVPVGSKGGFVVKKSMEGLSREQIQQEGIACYQTFIRALLDVTDNLMEGKPVAPTDVRCWDDADTYLVVAADKGTATFSDIANSISQEYNFWLGDAFASGGSDGYDHKKMAITARGAWESVKRHFRELDLNIDAEPYTLIGVGDMSGDVFGNALLLAKKARVLAAFNHQHIFLDPEPDIAKSYAERERLFKLPRSTWEDYNPKVISAGGGVFSRQLKTIPLTPEMQQLLQTPETSLKPNDIIKKLLCLNVDLLWFGGIGTFIKSSQESHSDVGDRSNDGVRVNAKDLRCRVIGEGANLGLTQLGRIEYARKADGRINTDFIDNSAGVSCSDHEVNIKILFNEILRKNKLTRPERNKLLTEMTDNVAQLVLIDNYLQPQAITFIEHLGNKKLDRQVRLVRAMEQEGLLNRQIEFLPDDVTFEEYQASQVGLCRPEIAVVLSYSKINYFQKILKTTIPEDHFFEKHLITYFPKALQNVYRKEILSHPLKREIIATVIVNDIVNRGGATFLSDAMDVTNAPLENVVQAYYVTESVFDLRSIWSQIESLDNKMKASAQLALMSDVYRMLRRISLWLLRYYPLSQSIEDSIHVLSLGIGSFLSHVTSTLDDDDTQRYIAEIKKYEAMGAPKALAERLSMLKIAATSPDIILIASETGYTVPEVAKLYFLAGKQFWFSHVRDIIERFNVAKSPWERYLLHALQEDLYNYQTDLIINLLNYQRNAGTARKGQTYDISHLIEHWGSTHEQLLNRIGRMFQESHVEINPDLAILTLVTRELKELSGS